MAAASVAWLEPSLILDAHAWPQWDVWCLPFFVFAALSASTGRWLRCGCLLALGAMFKGQLLIVAPFFLMWPMAGGQVRNALRALAGFSATVALVASPWLLPHPAACLGVAGATAVFWFLPVVRRLPDKKAMLCAFFAAAALATAVLGHGSFAWAKTGFLYGADEYPNLIMGPCYNLPALLKSLVSPVRGPGIAQASGAGTTAQSPAIIALKWMLRLAYLGALWMCARGAARLARNRDPRMLIALATPWLLMFALLGQMHERYLMWGAVVSSTALAVNARSSLIHFLFSAASTLMIVHAMLIRNQAGAATSLMVSFLDRITPLASLLVLLGVAAYLWECRACGSLRLQRRTDPVHS